MKLTLLSVMVTLFTLSLSSQTTILDFETPATSTTFQYFGSSLDPTLNNIIDNPDPTGINTSSKVADHVKPAGAMTWAGAFANPATQTPADMAVNSSVCLKVWFNAPGNVGIKLENSSNGGPVWVRTVDVAEAQKWAEVCIDVNLPSIEAPFSPAKGFSYDGVTLFFDFGTAPTADRTYYWDDFVTKSGGGPSEGDITFNVDMNGYMGSFTTVYVSGTFNTWSGDANPLADSDGDGIWTGTAAAVPVGVHEFKFTLDNWTAEESLQQFSPCVIATFDGGTGQTFVNRKLVVSDNATLPTYCFNSCFSCGNGVNITFQVGSGNVVTDPNGLYVAGGGNFGNPGDFPMKDDDGDGVWEITVERQLGFESFYTFTNGNCPDYSCKEDLSGLACGDPNNFNDRHLGPITENTTIATCFGECTDSFDSCMGTTTAANATFQVDMNGYSGIFTTAYVSGSMNGWSGDANPMTDTDGNGIWEITLLVSPDTYEYKFTLDNWTDQEQFDMNEPCVISINNGEFVNRIVEINGDITICYKWNTCTTCEPLGTNDLKIDNNLFSLQPNLIDHFTTLSFGQISSKDRLVRVYNAIGDLVFSQKLAGTTTDFTIFTGQYPKGIYLVNVLEGDVLGTKKMVKP